MDPVFWNRIGKFGSILVPIRLKDPLRSGRIDLNSGPGSIDQLKESLGERCSPQIQPVNVSVKLG